jgi:predicted nucleic acid-binding protein
LIVLDSSAAVDYLVDREYGAWVESCIDDDPDVHSPQLLDVEVASALRGLVGRRELGVPKARQALEELADFDVARYSHTGFLDRIWELRRHVTAYDALYLALAEALDATLVTTDARLARSHGHRARVLAP